MAYGKNGATCWLSGALRTLQKRVEWLEARAQHAAGPAPVVEHILQADPRSVTVFYELERGVARAAGQGHAVGAAALG